MKQKAILILFVCWLCRLGHGQGIFPAKELTPGLTGYCVTEIAQGERERLPVEVINLVSQGELNRRYLLIRLSGDRVATFGVASGMSGSPVYIQDRLVGALAFTWPFTREHVAGVTLYPDMVGRCAEISAPKRPLLTGLELAEMPKDMLADLLPRQSKPSATIPVAAVGLSLSADGLAKLPWSCEPHIVTSIAQGAYSPAEGGADLAAGSAFAVVLMRGDYQLAAFGTITAVTGDRFFGLGHSLFDAGKIKLPAASARTVYTIGSHNMSFKINEMGPIVGTLVADTDAGVEVTTREQPAFVPLTVNLVCNQETRDFHFDLAAYDLAVPGLMQLALLQAVKDVTGTTTLRGVDAVLSLSGDKQPEVRYHSVYGNLGALSEMVSDTTNMVTALLFNEFSPYPLRGIGLDIELLEKAETLTLKNVRMSRSKVFAGDTLSVQLLYQSSTGGQRKETAVFAIPEFFPQTRGAVAVLDRKSYILFELMRNPQRFKPNSREELLHLLNHYPAQNKIYVMVYLFSPGFSMGRREMHHLPAIQSMLVKDNSDSIKTLPQSLLAQQVIETDAVVTGSKTIPFVIMRK